LRNLASQKPSLVIFYRGGWCPYCNTHLSQLAEIEEQLYDMGIQILALSPDQPSYLKESTMEHNLNYKLLSDSDMNASKQFGLAFKVDTTTVNRYKRNGLDLAERSGYDHYMLPVPAAFFVDTTATIRYRYYNPDYTVRIDNEELLTTVKELM
jgi:peroxiredoxin